MVRNLARNKVLWLLTAVLSLAVALVGVINPNIYSKVVSDDVIPGVFGQDLMTIATSVILMLLVFLTKEGDSKKQIVVLGILGYLFYAYGIYVIEQVYNLLYYLYLAIFALSFWSMVYGVAKIRPDILQKAQVSGKVQHISAWFSLLVAVVFNILWIVQLLPLVQTGDKIENLYSVYILDLCFIMPALVIIGIMTLRKAGLGLMLIPAMFILGFTLIFSLAVSESVKPVYDLTISVGDLAPSLVLSILFLILAALHLRKLNFVKA
jgi:hypothetical protein